MVFFYKCKSFSIFPFTHSLPVKCPNFGVFSGPYLLLFKLNKEIYRVISVFSPTAVKCRREKLKIRTLFTQWRQIWEIYMLLLFHWPENCLLFGHMKSANRDWLYIQLKVISAQRFFQSVCSFLQNLYLHRFLRERAC